MIYPGSIPTLFYTQVTSVMFPISATLKHNAFKDLSGV
jgi:hypothetical protein